MPDLRVGNEGIRIPTFRFVCSACRQEVVGGQSEMINELVPKIEKDDPTFKYWDVVVHDSCCSPCTRRVKANNEKAEREIADIEIALAKGLPRPVPWPIPKTLQQTKAAEQAAMTEAANDLNAQILAALGTINTNLQNLDSRLQAVEQKPDQPPRQTEKPKAPKAKPAEVKKLPKLASKPAS